MAGHWNEVFPKFSNVLAAAPAILLLASVLRSHLEQLLLCCLLLLICNSQLFNGYMDGIVAIYFTAASLLIFTLTTSAEDTDLRVDERLCLFALTGIVFAILSLAKNDGMAALVALILVAVLTKLVFREFGNTFPIVLTFLISAIPVVAWKIHCARNGIGSDFAPSNLLTQLSRRAFSIDDHQGILSNLLWQKQILVPLALFVLAACGRTQRTVFWFVFLSVLSYGGILFIVYLSTPFDLRWQLANSADRTVLPIALMLGYYFIVMQRMAFRALA